MPDDVTSPSPNAPDPAQEPVRVQPRVGLQARLLERLSRRPVERIGFALLWALACVVLVVSLVTPTWRANDNHGIQLMLDADFDPPVFSLSLGWVVRVLTHSVSNQVPWFGLVNYFAVFCAIALAVHVLATMRRARRVFLLILVVFTAAIGIFLLRVGYNAASILLPGIGVLALVGYAREGVLSWRHALICGCAVGFGYLFRWQGAVGAMLFTLPVAAALAWRDFRRLSLGLAWFVVPVALAPATEFVWGRFIAPPEHREFMEFYRVRSQFHAQPAARANIGNHRLLRKNGWTPNDYELLRTWVFVDEDKYNVETLSNIQRYSVDLPHETLDPAFLIESGRKLFRRFWKFLPMFALVVVAAWLAPTRRVKWLTVGYVAGVVLLAFGMQIWWRFPSRAGDPLLVIAGLAGAWIVMWGSDREYADRDRSPRWIRPVFMSLAIASFGVFAGVDVYQALGTERGNERVEGNTETMNRLFRGKMVLAQAGELHTFRENPLRVEDYEFERVPTGWRTFSPLFYQFLRRHGLERGSELLPFAIDNDDFFFLFEQEAMLMIAQFVLETYGIQCKIRYYDDTEINWLRIYQLRSDPEGPHPDSKPGKPQFRGELGQFTPATELPK